MAEPSYTVRVVGAPRAPLRDFYHALMRLSWLRTLGVIATGFLALNALFACGYLWVGGVANAKAHSWLDAFFFSVQTMGTIGYGAMWPASRAANALVVAEAVCSLVVTALATGLVFAKFSLPTARIMFSRHLTISRVDGKPTLSFRVGNLRSNRIVEAVVRAALTRTERTQEGKVFYRMVDLKLIRDRILSLTRSWTVLHVIDEASPLWGETKDSLAQKEAEINVTILGTDDTWMQTVHSSHVYMDTDLAWGMRHTDVLSEDGAGLVLDLTKFHDLEPAPE